MPPSDELLALITRYWGYESFRPLQEPAMRAVLTGRDSLVVLPTGAGKSLCYQAPALLTGGTTVVVSPLIALMKDQVDSLRACGIAAAQLDSSLTAAERLAVEGELRRGRISLLFVSPERLMHPETSLRRTLRDLDVRHFAIDEAHCISHWGHDFRPEYRMLSRLREEFAQASMHAYTATATEKVRRDIVAQLALHDPEVLVGNFDRPNLTYRVWPRQDVLRQVLEVLERHPAEAGIIYCMRRADVDDLAAKLQGRGVLARAYHAGLSDEQRQRTQEEFASEQCDLVVATIAFGMGINRSNVRFVLHTALPKSIEHYQQETGRAGRDGLEAECVLLYSGGDVVRLKAIIEKSAAEAEDRSFLPGVLKHLEDMDRFARGAVCRHKALVEYFGQSYSESSCQACDLCLGDSEEVPDALRIAQMILSCVARVRESFGLNHVLDVLRGKSNDKIRTRRHDQLTTYGLLKEYRDAEIRDWIYQLIGQEVLVQTEDEYPKLVLNDASWEVMRGQRRIRLIRLVRRQKGEKPQHSQRAVESWEGVEHGLFESLRQLRRQLALDRQVPPYVIFSDATLRELARKRPGSVDALRNIYGVGETKRREYGPAFVEQIVCYCKQHELSVDRTEVPIALERDLPGWKNATESVPAFGRKQELFALFREGLSIAEISERTRLAMSTVRESLAWYLRLEAPQAVTTWVEATTYERVVSAARQVGIDKLKPIFLALGEKVPYDTIRLVVSSLQGQNDRRL